ncbi:MAG: hypothetical protein GY756_13510 [bacterium]|nr:hypothetical protein [bacterium]
MIKPCTKCKKIKDGFEKNGYNEYVNLRNLVKTSEIVFLAGNCPIDDIEDHLEKGDLYTIEHYFQCECGLIYYTGFCIYGRPIVKTLKELPDNLKTIFSNCFGEFFN